MLLRLSLQFLIVEMDREQRVGMEGVSILSDKVSILSSEWQNLSLFLGNIGDYILQRRHSWNTILFKHWYYCDMLFTHNSSASLMRVYWKPFLILSPGAWCQCPGSPVPRSQWRTVTDHSRHWWQSHSRAEANLGAGDFGHCVQELCCAILRWKKCLFVFKWNEFVDWAELNQDNVQLLIWLCVWWDAAV